MTHIYYLAHPYTNDPKQSFINACEWTAVLRTRGLVVFSPILHTHPYHKYLCRTRQQTSHAMDDQMNYVQWDLDLLTQFKAGDGFQDHICPVCKKRNRCDSPAYFECDCGTSTPPHWIDLWKIQYDSGVIILLSKTAYQYQYIQEPNFEKSHGIIENASNVVKKEKKWLSSGCEQEYNWTKTHHVRVLELESFLENIEVDL